MAKSAQAHHELRQICDLDQEDGEKDCNMYWSEALASKLNSAFDLMKSRSPGMLFGWKMDIGGRCSMDARPSLGQTSAFQGTWCCYLENEPQ